MKRVLPLLLILLVGCASGTKYNYQSQSSADPQLIFGDRFGGSVLNGPTRGFSVNTHNAALHKCADFVRVGTVSSDLLYPASKTVEIKVPAKKAVSIFGSYSFLGQNTKVTCVPPALMFSPQEGAVYSIDIENANNRCALSIMRKLPDGKLAAVTGITVLPGCND